MNRLLPTAVCILVTLWTLASLVNLWEMLRPQQTEAAEISSSLLSGDTTALPLLAASHPEALTLDLLHELAAHPDERLRELTAHQEWTPHVSIGQQIKVVQGLEPAWLRERGTLWLTRRATSQNTLTLRELETYWSPE